MYLTEEEAKEKQCCHRFFADQKTTAMPRCAGSMCMAWRWAESSCLRETDGCDEPRGTRCDECPKQVRSNRGYCGLAGEVL